MQWSPTLSPYLTLTVANISNQNIVFKLSNYNWVKLMWNINHCLVQGSISNVQSSWDSSCAMAAICWRATAADLLGWNSGAWACRVTPLSSTGRSQDNSRGYKCCTIALNRTSQLSAVLLSPCHLCLELAVWQYWTFIFLGHFRPLWSEQRPLGSQSLLLFCSWDCDALLMR